MNRKISRKEKHKYSNEEKLALGEDQNTNSVINIAQEDDSNIFELLPSLRINNLRFTILNCSTFCLLVTFVFISLLLYTIVLMVRKGKKKAVYPPPPDY